MRQSIRDIIVQSHPRILHLVKPLILKGVDLEGEPLYEREGITVGSAISYMMGLSHFLPEHIRRAQKEDVPVLEALHQAAEPFSLEEYSPGGGFPLKAYEGFLQAHTAANEHFGATGHTPVRL
ncbi:MAG: hypothetical protein OXR66_01300 [Candidatus Woesearchaeota archaeon]|nr:hypothetical protein [Candidatus Woesearchaeota archaeon]